MNLDVLVKSAVQPASYRAIPKMEIAKLTADHAASTHGLPVVVRQSDGAVGPAEIGPVYACQYVETDDVAGRDIYRPLTVDEIALVEAARRAGYDVRYKTLVGEVR